MKTIHNTPFRVQRLVGALTLAACFAASPALAQESEEEIEYEFAFAYEEDESYDDRQDRLEEEVADYCDGYDASYYCEDEITDAVNDQMEDDQNTDW